jgi:DNA-binding winged helix-turn-helix (wHTH) protein
VGSIFSFDEFELDLEKKELRRDGVPMKTDPLLLRLLDAFVRSPQQVVGKEQLLARVWDGRVVSDNSLAVAITRLRKLLGHERAAREVVVTVHRQGYRFAPSVVERDVVAPHSMAPGSRPPFVGRERILSQLSSALAEASSGSGGAIVLTGEAGIGKSRVAEVLAREAGTNVAVAWAYCRELGETPPLWPFVEILRAVLARVPREDSTFGPRFQALVPELARLLPELVSSAESAALQPEAADAFTKPVPKHRLFDAITRALSLVSEHEPWLLIFDDLHRADPASLELIHYFLSELPRTRILLLATSRNVQKAVPNSRLTRVLNHRNCTRIALQPLSDAQVTSYVVALFGDEEQALGHAIFKKSEGNALFMTELARQLSESETRDISNLMTPNVAAELTWQRLAGLDQATRSALRWAAVIGRNFSLALLQAISGRDAPDLMSSLDAAVSRAIVLPARDAPAEFTFSHELMRSALYEALDPAERRSCHLRVAQALELRVARGEVPAADLAFHARAALPDGNLRKTVDYCIEASNAAMRVCATVDAARYLQHARQALELMAAPNPGFRFRLLLRQAAHVRSYSTREFRPLAQQLLHAARELGDGVALAYTAWMIDPFPGFPRMEGSQSALIDSLAKLPEQEPSMRSALLARLATCTPLAYDATGSAAQLERALELARTSPQFGDRMTTRFTELYLYGGPANKARSLDAMRWLQDVSDKNASDFSVPLVVLDMHRAIVAVQEGDLATMTRALDRSEARCREFDLELLWHVERFRALARINAGHVAEGRVALLKVCQRAVRLQPIGASVFCAYDRSVALAGVNTCGRQWESALAPNAEDPPNIWAMKVRALAAAGSKAEASSALEAVSTEALRRLPCDREYLGTLGALARAALILQAPDYARVLYELLSPYPEHFAVNLAFVCEGSVSQLLGMLARSLGERSTARQHLQAAVAMSEQAGLATCAAEARLELQLC